MVDVNENLRADARNNRDRILKVARDAFATDPEASLHSIARTAGIGQGTLYRHFRTREALVLAVYRKEVDALVELAPALLAEHPAFQAFRVWCDQFAEYGRRKHGIAEVVRAAMSAQDFQQTYWPIVDAVRQLLEACHRSGEIPPGIDAEDFTQLLGCMLHLPPNSDGEARTKRLLALIFRGLSISEDSEGRSPT